MHWLRYQKSAPGFTPFPLIIQFGNKLKIGQDPYTINHIHVLHVHILDEDYKMHWLTYQTKAVYTQACGPLFFWVLKFISIFFLTIFSLIRQSIHVCIYLTPANDSVILIETFIYFETYNSFFRSYPITARWRKSEICKTKLKLNSNINWVN